MKRFIMAMLAAGVLALGGGMVTSAQAAVAGPGTSAIAADGLVEKTARVCGPYGCRYVPGPYYGRPRYARPYYAPRRYYAPRPYYAARPYYGRRCWVRPTPYGPQRVCR